MLVVEYTEAVIKPMLSRPEALKISHSLDAMGVLLIIDIAKEDMSIVIGKGGNTAKSIRTLVKIVGLNERQRVSIRLNEPTLENNTNQNE